MQDGGVGACFEGREDAGFKGSGDRFHEGGGGVAVGGEDDVVEGGGGGIVGQLEEGFVVWLNLEGLDWGAEVYSVFGDFGHDGVDVLL